MSALIAQGASSIWLIAYSTLRLSVQFSSVRNKDLSSCTLHTDRLPGLTAWGDCWHWCYSRRSPAVMLPDRPSRRKYCYGLSRSAADRAPAGTAVASEPHCCRTVVPFPRAAGQTFPPGAYLTPLERCVFFFIWVSYFVPNPVVRWNDIMQTCFLTRNKSIHGAHSVCGFNVSRAWFGSSFFRLVSNWLVALKRWC